MIVWKKYEKRNHPECGKEFLVFTKYGSIVAAELQMWTDGELRWTENQEQLVVNNVTHYAEINLPSGGTSEKPTVEQVAWVLEKISEHMNDGGGTYRYLIYDRMGFDESAYVTLQQAGGLAISNMIDEWLEMKEGQK